MKHKDREKDFACGLIVTFYVSTNCQLLDVSTKDLIKFKVSSECIQTKNEKHPLTSLWIV